MCRQDRTERVQDGVLVLIREPKNQYPRMRPGRVAPDVSETPIESEDHAVLGTGGGNYGAILRATHALLKYGGGVVPELCDQTDTVRKQILVELDPQSAKSGSGRSSSLAKSAP